MEPRSGDRGNRAFFLSFHIGMFKNSFRAHPISVLEFGDNLEEARMPS